jgi:hypothetical protein
MKNQPLTAKMVDSLELILKKCTSSFNFFTINISL